ncbi:MAG: serine/threonine protein kinase [Myxococcales bacterium]|nr:serine/threonine protein kinase [Myxococcales bacterium]
MTKPRINPDFTKTYADPSFSATQVSSDFAQTMASPDFSATQISPDFAQTVARPSTALFAEEVEEPNFEATQAQPLPLATGSPDPLLEDPRKAPSSGIHSLRVHSSAGNLDQLHKQALRTTILPRLQKAPGEELPQLVIENQLRYERKKELGKGAMGEVTLAFDRDIQRMVAVKHLKPDLHTASPVIRFAEEIRIVGQLEHPNIVPIHDVGLDPAGHYYFVMKYVQGETMEEIIEKLAAGDAQYHERFPLGVRIQIFLDILKAIDFAHSEGIIHRDLKPANIMIGPHNEVLVMDWGIAKRLSKEEAEEVEKAEAPRSPRRTKGNDFLQELMKDLQKDREQLSEQIQAHTQNNRLIGTPMYMSPEQAMGFNDRIDERSDLFSLSVILYEFLGLRHYLSSKENLFELLFSIAKEEPQTIFTFRHASQPNIPIEISHFVSKGMRKDPQDRFQSASEMHQALTKLQAGYFQIECPTTLMKRSIFSVLHFIDKFPQLAYWMFVGGSGLLLLAVVFKLLDFFLPT